MLQIMGSQRVGHDLATELNAGCRETSDTMQSKSSSVKRNACYMIPLIHEVQK